MIIMIIIGPPVSTVFDEQREVGQVFPAGVGRVESHQFPEHSAPAQATRSSYLYNNNNYNIYMAPQWGTAD